MKKLILAGDIGGTKTVLQIFETDGSHYTSLYKQRYSSIEYGQFDVLLAAFLREAQASIKKHVITAACLGIAGTINGRQAQVTNLPWLIDAEALQQQFAMTHLELINDFAAIGYGLGRLQQDDFYVLQTGNPLAMATRAVIGAGTGLGEGYLVWQGDQYRPLPSEGGHSDFAPQNEIQHDLLRYLQNRYDHVSYERVVSGNGLINIYNFLTDTHPASEILQQELKQSADHAAIITAYALENKDAVAVQALNIFIECYGAQAGNLALTCLARGGVYIAGGIAPKILQRLQRGDFMKAFCNKGRFSALMRTIPVSVVLNTDVALHGAADRALRLNQDYS